MSQASAIALGLDFGTESVRALFVDLEGNEKASAVVAYPHGQIIDSLPGTNERLPADFALQHPLDWIESAAQAVRTGLTNGSLDPTSVMSIGVDFTSCTMLPALRNGTPLCVESRWAAEKFAWPKLWKHHGAKSQTDRINAVARERNEPWLARYGGTIGLEWFFPKILETLENAPAVYEAAEVWLEAGRLVRVAARRRRRVAVAPLDVPGGLQGDVASPRRVPIARFLPRPASAARRRRQNKNARPHAGPGTVGRPSHGGHG